MNPSRKYRLIVVVLAILSFTTLAEIVGVVIWRDYRAHGAVSFTRALGGLYANVAQGKDPGVDSTGRPGLSESVNNVQPVLGSLPEHRQRMLYLINTERVRARVAPLTMSDNPSAQYHAGNMMEYGYRSHWDINGLTPAMRYTLSGGVQRVVQNIAGPIELAETEQGESPGFGSKIIDVHRQIMSSGEEAANVLDPWHRRVSLGVACRQGDCWVVQQFETDLVDFDALPSIRNGMLTMSGEIREGLELDSVALWYHAYPRPLSLGQLDATYKYGYGQRPATFVRPGPIQDSYYPNTQVNYEWSNGIDPYTLQPLLGRSMTPPLRIEVAQSASVPWTTADHWEQSESYFSVSANVAEVLSTEGPGVYTVQMWGRHGEERVPLSNYAIFVR